MAVDTNEGTKAWHVYTDDKDNLWSVYMDTTLAALGGLPLATAGSVPAEKPRRLKMRRTYYKAADSTSKYRGFIPTGSTALTPTEGHVGWNNVSSAITVNGVACVTTGRTGEKNTFPIGTGSASPSPSPSP